MKEQLLTALTRSPWVMLGAAVCLLLALWLVMRNSYALSIRTATTGLELKPAAVARPSPP